MLFTDCNILTPEQLDSADAQLRRVLEAEQIDLEGTNGLLATVIDECQTTLLETVHSYACYTSHGDVESRHLAAVMGPVIGAGPVITPQQIVIHNEFGGNLSPLQFWARHRAISAAYRAAFNNSTNDQYLVKMRAHDNEAKTKWDGIMRSGLPYVTNPLDRPAATRRPHSGAWGGANVSMSATGSSAAGSYEVAITYTGANYTNGNAESAPSERLSITVFAGRDIQVNIDSLNPPTGIRERLSPVNAIAATGWNIYAGPAGGSLRLQHDAPIPIDTKLHTFAFRPTGKFLGNGQMRDAYLTIMRSIIRA